MLIICYDNHYTLHINYIYLENSISEIRSGKVFIKWYNEKSVSCASPLDIC